MVIKGISDFADAAKADEWQPYASMAAATLAVWLIGEEML